METNNAVATVASGMSTKNLVSKRGRVLGTRTVFTGAASAREVAIALKAKGIKGAELKRQVNAVLTGEKDLRVQVGTAWLQMAFQSGYVPDTGTLRKNAGALSLVKIGETESAEAKEAKRLAAELETMRAELAALKAQQGK